MVPETALRVIHGLSVESVNGNGPDVVSSMVMLLVVAAAPACTEKDKEVGIAKMVLFVDVVPPVPVRPTAVVEPSERANVTVPE